MDFIQHIGIYRKDVERQLERFQDEKAKLYKDGKPIYAPDAHKEWVEALLAPVRQSVQDAQELAQKALVESNNLQTMQHADPLLALGVNDLQKAEALKPFVQEETETLGFEALAQRLTAVLHHGDEVSKILYQRYGQRRLDGIQKAVYERRMQLLGDDAEMLGQVRQALGQITEALVSSKDGQARAKAVKTAEELRTKAAELTRFARQKLSEADGTRERALESQRAFSSAHF